MTGRSAGIMNISIFFRVEIVNFLISAIFTKPRARFCAILQTEKTFQKSIDKLLIVWYNYIVIKGKQ